MARKSKRPFVRNLFRVVLALFLVLAVWVVIMRSFKYEYNQQADYKYDFSSMDSQTFELSLENNRIQVGEMIKGFQTAFIEMDVNYTIKGFTHEPKITMTAGNDTLFQNLECRTKGVRYLNVSQLIQHEAGNIQFEFRGCKPKSASVKLIAYKNLDPSKENILILAPHPDDAEIAAYGLYASNPKNTFIATITAGDAGSMNYNELYIDSTRHYIKKGEVRAWNSITIPMLAGVAPDNCINLGYFDASLRNMHDDTTTLAKSRYINTTNINLFRSKNCANFTDSLKSESTWRSLVNDMKYLLLKVKPTLIVSAYPALDYHFDHKFTTVALIQAMQELNYQNCQLWLYTNHLPLTTMYPDGQIGSQISLPPHFENEPIYFDKLFSFPLSKNLQSDKVLALDAMNDLRPDTEYRYAKVLWDRTKQTFFDKLYLKESDYFRRSVRSNELFFVIEGRNIFKSEIRSKIYGDL